MSCCACCTSPPWALPPKTCRTAVYGRNTTRVFRLDRIDPGDTSELVTPVGEPVAGPEGCLSFPEIFADITRAEKVDVKALDAKGEPIAFRAGGLLGRAVQHEVDHLNGVLFIDRMNAKDKAELRPEIDELHTATKKTLAKKK